MSREKAPRKGESRPPPPHPKPHPPDGEDPKSFVVQSLRSFRDEGG